MEPAEIELLRQLRTSATREQAYRQLVVEYQKRIYSLVRKMVINHDDADDLVQDVFVKVWNNLDSFKGDSHLFTWIYRIATNECLQFLRRKKRWTIFGMDDNSFMENQLQHEDSLSGDQIQMKLQKAILTLPDKQRLIFNMRYYEDLKYSEIAAITNRTEGNLKANYHHAVKKIENYLNGN